MYRPFPIKALCVRHFLSLLVVIALGMTLPGGVGGCGGAVSNGEEEAGAPTIESITGDGSASDRFEDSLIISGENFIEGMTVGLQGTDNDMDFDLGYTLDSSTQITANLPSTLTEGSYDLVITSATGSASAAVTILRGEDGMTFDTQYSCYSSSDFDTSADQTVGLDVEINNFSDGSYFMSCCSFIFNNTLAFVDSTCSSSWFGPNTVSVTSGSLLCISTWVAATYSTTDHTVTYTNLADTSQTETIACVLTGS